MFFSNNDNGNQNKMDKKHHIAAVSPWPLFIDIVSIIITNINHTILSMREFVKKAGKNISTMYNIGNKMISSVVLNL